MRLRTTGWRYVLAMLAVSGLLLPRMAGAATCETESQMTAAQRGALANVARNMVSKVQTGDVQALRAQTIPAVASQFGAIASAANRLKPLVQSATITVDNVYAMDASSEQAGSSQTEFYCGTPVVMLTFSNLPPGKYGLTIVHATGVPKPQQIALILSETPANGWMLAGFVSRPMMEAGHNGVWYWEQAREYAQKKMNWNAWFYYQTAAYLLNPAEFLSSPNMQKLKKEMDAAQPAGLPGAKPMILNANGSAFSITSVGTTTEFGGLDLEINYVPDATQIAQLRDPVAARKQVVALMAAMLESYPELRAGFHGIWVRAQQGNAPAFALDLPMNQIETNAS
ncbi:MAG: hypothetical protein WBD10_13080 [Acidobacteriaceae bacterium]